MTSVSDPPQVLVVDDRAPKRYLLVNWLKRAGYAVNEACSGAEALESIDAHSFDLIVLDVRLPDISGLEVCKRIKEDPRHSSIPVVHVSAHAVDPSDRTLGLISGADAYLVEPIDPRELVATVQAVLRYYRARRDAEDLAEGLARLADATLAVTTAETFTELVTVAATGTARLFGSAAFVATKAVDNGWVAAAASDPDSVVLTNWKPPATAVPIGSRIVTGRAWDWKLPGDNFRDESVAVATARLRADGPSLYVAIPLSALDSREQLLTQLTQALAASAERSARTMSTTASRSRCSAACCPSGCPKWMDSTWPCATNRPVPRRRSAVTSTNCPLWRTSCWSRSVTWWATPCTRPR